MHKVFVYGTLKKKYGNHSCLHTRDENTKYIGSGKTNEKFALYAQGIPFVFKDEKISNISGELYEVTEDTLVNALDRLEGHPRWYCRELVDVTCNGELHKAWIYFNNKSGRLIESGNYDDYARF